LEKLQPIFRSLPLEACAYERNTASGEIGWHAPRNQAFKLTGQFTEFTDSFGDYTVNASKELFIAGHADLYQDCLFRAKGNEGRALTLLLREINKDAWFDDDKTLRPTDHFIGKWLMIKPYSDELVVQRDINVAYYGLARREPYVEDVEEGIIDPKAGESQMVIDLQRDYAVGMTGKFRIEMARVRDRKSQLFVPASEASIEIASHRPLPDIPSSDWCDVLYGKGNYSEDTRRKWLLGAREEGRPFGDDPLRDLILPNQQDIKERLRALNVAIEPPKRVVGPILVFPGHN
jgi:hypothetical protein